MKIVKFKGGRFSLHRDRDNAGDSGMMLNCIDPATGEVVATNEIRVGHCVQCGSFYARTMQRSDWWLTTPITEITKVNEDATEVEFKTGNSVYTLTSRGGSSMT